jgi:tRNA A-37 threonylcarbamoyl transferase component Bud32
MRTPYRFIKDKYFKDSLLSLSRINSVEILENQTVYKKAGPDFYRKRRKFSTVEAIQREVEILKVIEYARISPRVLDVGSDFFIMEYAGVPLTKETLPHNWRQQISEILKTFQKHKIIHRDIKQKNLLVLEGKLTLIDYGWSIAEGRDFFICPQDLCQDIPKEMIYDNSIALHSTVNNL